MEENDEGKQEREEEMMPVRSKLDIKQANKQTNNQKSSLKNM